MTLHADEFANDPRVAQAKRLIADALAEHQRKLTGIRAADPTLKQSYDDTIKRFGELRGGSLYYPYLGSGFGKGALVELADGSVKFDFITGIGVHAFGHSHPGLIEALLDAAIQDTVMQGNLQQNRECVALAQTLVDTASRKGAAIKHCFLSSSGAMANENALKLILQKKSPANRILAFEHAFAGRSLALSQITDKPAYRAGLPQTLSVDYVPFFDADHARESTARAVEVLKSHLARFPKQHAAMHMELIIGEGGYLPGDRAFFVALIETLKNAGIAIFVDEIQTFGRTTEPFAFQHFGVDSFVDVVTVGKLTQVCATLFTADYKPQPGLVSQTFTGSTSSIFAARYILDTLLNGGYFGKGGRIARLSTRFVERLKSIAQRHPDRLRGPFGAGAMVAMTVLDGSEATSKKFLHALFAAGVIGFIAGENPSRVRFLIPFAAVADEDIDAVCAMIDRTLGSMASS